MKLRIKTVAPIYSGGTICNAPLVFVVEPTIVIKVNGVIVPCRSIGTGVIEVSINLREIWQSAEVEVTCTLSDYYTYHNIFTIFGYDIGSYISGSTLLPFIIYMIQEDYRTALQKQEEIAPGVPNPDYIPNPIRRTHSKVIAYRKPFTDEIYYYWASSNPCTVSLFDSTTGEIFSSNKNGVICNSDDFGIIPYSEIYSASNCCGGSSSPVIEDYCLGTKLIVEGITVIPTISSAYGCDNCDNSQITTISTNYVLTEIDFSLLTCFIVDNIVKSPFTDIKLVRKVYGIGSMVEGQDVKGIVIATNELILAEEGVHVTTLPILVNQCPAIVDPTTGSTYGGGILFKHSWSGFTTPDVGDYLIETSFIVGDRHIVDGDYQFDDCITIINRDTITSCHWYNIEQTACDVYEITNYSFDTITLEILELNEDLEFESSSSTEITACNKASVNLTDDGIYKFICTRGINTYSYIVINYCGVQDCYLSFLEKVICCNPLAECSTIDTYNYNVFNALINMMMMQLNTEYGFSFIYEFISEDKLQDLYNYKQLLDRIELYCRECNLPAGCNESTTSNCSGCNS